MSNMSYCRFRNTLKDFRDCSDAMEAHLNDPDEEMSKEEEAANELLDSMVDYLGRMAEFGELPGKLVSKLRDVVEVADKQWLLRIDEKE